MSMKLTPRPFQIEAVAAAWKGFCDHPGGNPLLVLPTGSGKSIIVAMLCQDAITQWRGVRIIMLVRSKELCEQNLAKLKDIWPEAPVGVHSASLGGKDLHHDILYCTIGSVWKKAHKLGRRDIVIVDEAHMVDSSNVGTYRKFLDDLAKYNPHVRTMGLTATPFRGNGVWLTAGKEALFTHIAFTVTLQDLLSQGFLSPLVPATSQVLLSSDGVSDSGGDFNTKELAEKHDRTELVSAACDEICRQGADRKSWIVFCVTIAHCTHVRDELLARGIVAEVVSATTEKAERARHIAGHRAGSVRCLISVNALSVGFDSPATDLVVLMRATKAPTFFVQCAGRGMRIAPGKTDCLWLDLTDTTARLGPVDLIKGRLPRASKSDDSAPWRLCVNCGSRNAAGATECADCGFQFPPPERIKHGSSSDGAAVLSSQIAQDITHQITQVEYAEHRKIGADHTSLRIEYWAGPVCVAKQWQFPDMKGYRRLEFEAWWRQRGGGRIPLDTREAVERAKFGELTHPPGLVTRRNSKTKHHDIVGFLWRMDE